MKNGYCIHLSTCLEFLLNLTLFGSKVHILNKYAPSVSLILINPAFIQNGSGAAIGLGRLIDLFTILFGYNFGLVFLLQN